MTRERNGGSKLLFAGLCVGVVVCLIVESGRFRSPAHFPPMNADDNPNKFVLWTGESSIRYTFTYDPHAADVWLFQSGGRPATGTNAILPKPKWYWTK
jgi:hypothetical protein